MKEGVEAGVDIRAEVGVGVRVVIVATLTRGGDHPTFAGW